MKCEIAKDLLTLYAEQLCSAETARALEAHLEECPECRAQLEHYRNLLGEETQTQFQGEAEENQVQLKPMKKIRKKLRHRIILSVVLGLILLVLLGGIGVLSYGEMTNRCISFSAIADIAKLNKVTRDLTKGDAEGLVDVLAYRIEDYYAVKKLTDFEDMDAFKEALRQKMDEAYVQYFDGRDIRVKFSGMELIPFEEGVDMGEGEVSIVNLSATGYYFDFYEGDSLILGLQFAKMGDNSFLVMEYAGDSDVTENNDASFSPATLPFDSVLMDVILRYVPQYRYEEVMAGDMDGSYRFIGMMLRDAEPGSEDDKLHTEVIHDRMQELLEDGWVLKDCLYAPDTYDMEQNYWRYKVWFQFENMETGESCVMEQKFRLHEVNLYVIDDQPATMLGTCESLTLEAEAKMLALFR